MMNDIGHVRLISPFQVVTLLDFHITQRPNAHVKMMLSAIVTEQAALIPSQMETRGMEVKLVLETDADDETLFCGCIDDVEMSFEKEFHHMSLTAVSASRILDEKQNSESFQNEKMSYKEMHEKVLSKYAQYNVLANIEDSRPIPAPCIQYIETDFEYFIRTCSHFHTVLYADASRNVPDLYFGLPKGYSHTIEDGLPWRMEKDLYRYCDEQAQEAGIDESEFIRYTIEYLERYRIGDTITVNERTLRVLERETYNRNGMVWNRYVLGDENALYHRKRYCPHISGLSLSGTVIARQGQALKLHLNIDKEQPVETAYWFPYEPPTGTIMYCMPVLGTEVSVTIPERNEQPTFAFGCIRHNGQVEPQTADPDTRYLHTEDGAFYRFTPQHVCICSPHENIELSIWEEPDGIVFSSDDQIQVNAGQNIEFVSEEGDVLFSAPAAGKKVVFASRETSYARVDSEKGHADIVSANDVYAELTSGGGDLEADYFSLSPMDMLLMAMLGYINIPDKIGGRDTTGMTIGQLADAMTRENAWPTQANGGMTPNQFREYMEMAANDPDTRNLRLVEQVNNNPYAERDQYGNIPGGFQPYPEDGGQKGSSESGGVITQWIAPNGEKIFIGRGSEGGPVTSEGVASADWGDNFGFYSSGSSVQVDEYTAYVEKNKSSVGNWGGGHSLGGSGPTAQAANDPNFKGYAYDERGVSDEYLDAVPGRRETLDNHKNFSSICSEVDLVSNLGGVLNNAPRSHVGGVTYQGAPLDVAVNPNTMEWYTSAPGSQDEIDKILAAYDAIGESLEGNPELAASLKTLIELYREGEIKAKITAIPKDYNLVTTNTTAGDLLGLIDNIAAGGGVVVEPSFSEQYATQLALNDIYYNTNILGSAEELREMDILTDEMVAQYMSDLYDKPIQFFPTLDLLLYNQEAFKDIMALMDYVGAAHFPQAILEKWIEEEPGLMVYDNAKDSRLLTAMVSAGLHEE